MVVVILDFFVFNFLYSLIIEKCECQFLVMVSILVPKKYDEFENQTRDLRSSPIKVEF